MNMHFVRFAGLFAWATLTISPALAELRVLTLPSGYTSSSVELGAPFAGALAFHPANPNLCYASVGSFASMSILSVDVANATTRTVVTGLGNVGGLAVLPNGDLAISENYSSDTLLRARDLNLNGDFLQTGELTELISPILADGGDFTGAHLAVAPAGNPSGIPTGSLLLQTADGATSSELLVIQSPETATPSYRPAGGAYYSGFPYNGGFGFTSSGAIIHGDSEWNPFTFMAQGRLVALVNSNADSDIDPGEKNEVVPQSGLQAGLTDLAVSADDQVFLTENSGSVRRVTLPGNLLTGTSVPGGFAETNGVYLSTVRFDRPNPNFAVGTGTAKLYIGGYTTGFVQASNLAVIRPAGLSSAEDWALFQ